MKKIILLINIIFILASCDYRQSQISLTDNNFMAVSMPDSLITKNPFPADSILINKWVMNSNAVNNLETNQNIINHGWAIWQALTEYTNQNNHGLQLRRFETWYTPKDIIGAYKLRKINPEAELKHLKRHTGELTLFNQLHDVPVPKDPSENSVVGFVKYDPTAAEHIYDNNLYYTSKLDSLLMSDQIANIPDFPNSGVVLKPVFTVLDSINPVNDLFVIPVWPGDAGNPRRPFDSDHWNNYVYVTTGAETFVKDKIYSINDFIHFQLDSAQAKAINGESGDYVVLLAMHVTTRETKRWTWQTFWWSAFNDTPQGPSSQTIAALRPDGALDRGARHYAMAIAYNMVQPAQPYYGGTGTSGTSLYAYNPYLEAGFDTSTFSNANDSIQKYYNKDYQKVGGYLNQYGMQTNCMSCHGQARYIPGLFEGKGHMYITDQYFDLHAPYFKNTVKLDFTWSIQGNLIDDNEEPIKNKKLK